MPSTNGARTTPVEAWESSVERLQSAVATGRPVMIPGTLEPLLSRPAVIEPASPHDPQSTPVGPDAMPEYEHKGAAPPAVSAVPLDRIASMMLQLTEWFIRRLRTA